MVQRRNNESDNSFAERVYIEREKALSKTLSYEEMETEIVDLKADYDELMSKYDKLLTDWTDMVGKQPPPVNEQLRLAHARIRTSETYLVGYEEYYGTLPAGLHTAILLMSAIPHMPEDTRKARARELAHDAKQYEKEEATLLNTVKGWFTRGK